MATPELEISLNLRDTASYAVQARFRPAEGNVESREESYPVRFDFERLRASAADASAYGRLLGDCLFGDPKIRDLLVAARAASGEDSLRLRLGIDAWSLALHRLRWETLAAPGSGRSLVADQKVWFSRHLASPDMRPIRLRSASGLRVLVATANPSNLASWTPPGRILPPVVREDEERMIREAMGSDTRGQLGAVESCAATLPGLAERLRAGIDILYLVCHGVLDRNDEPQLLLEDAEGRVALTPGADLVAEFDKLQKLPRLVVLASCQSAGGAADSRPDDEGKLAAAIGPRLARAGVPAVVAMLGDVFVDTAHAFLTGFFKELMRDGQVDRAMTEARNRVADRPDNWSPVLFTRLVDGRLWYARGGSTRTGTLFQAWPAIISQIEEDSCVPVLGSGLLEPYIGSQRDLARRLADLSRYPIAKASAELTQVAQFLSTTSDYATTVREYLRGMSDALKSLHPGPEGSSTPPGTVPPPRPAGAQGRPEAMARNLLAALSEAGARLRAANTNDSHRILASLGFPLYVTTTPDNLLADALREAGKAPREQLYRWRAGADGEAEAEADAALEPTVDKPLVHQLYGNFSDISSLVLTEDDYFKYLLKLAGLRSRSSVVRSALTESGLLFLGFRLDDWDFRVFFQFLRSREGRQLQEVFLRLNIAVQIDPEDGLTTEPARVRQFLERHFGSANTNIYWGSTEEFLQELREQWEARARN